MPNHIVVYIVLAAIVSTILAAFMYLYKNKNKANGKYSLFLLRFVSLFSLLLLLINPKFKKQIINTIKPSLVVLTDDSKSIKKLNQQGEVNRIFQNIKTNSAINEKFDVVFHSFTNDLLSTDSLNFKANETNIYQTLKSVNKLYNKSIAPLIIITDGNQTIGSNYSNFNSKQNLYPVIVGDTTTYQDLKITQLNVNKYAYLKHKFPIETFVVYEGDSKNVAANFTITKGKQTIFSKKINLSTINNSQQISFHLPANSVGLHQYRAGISILKNEKNTINNISDFAVEVINEKSKILLVSDILHPDIGMLKRTIESNKQRKLVVKKPTEQILLSDYQMVILYQPTVNFATLFSELNTSNKNFLIFTGSKTDWVSLNQYQTFFSKKVIQKTEDYLANYNSTFSPFLTNDINFENFSPVTDFFGDVSFNIPYETFLFQQIGSYSSKSPLLATFENNGRRGAVFLGEHVWRWRMNSQIEKKSFENFDTFFNKIIQYLSSSKRSSLLEIENKPYFYINDEVKIKAQFFDANYEFNPNAKLWITITNKTNKKQLKYPFALQNNSFEVSIADLKSGNYYFTVTNQDKKNSAKGSFTILNYNMEEQFTTANKKDLDLLASANNTSITYPDKITTLLDNLVANNKYVAIQKAKEKITTLIDWKYLLGIIVLALSVEWFMRKYKGYI